MKHFISITDITKNEFDEPLYTNNVCDMENEKTIGELTISEFRKLMCDLLDRNDIDKTNIDLFCEENIRIMNRNELKSKFGNVIMTITNDKEINESFTYSNCDLKTLKKTIRKYIAF